MQRQQSFSVVCFSAIALAAALIEFSTDCDQVAYGAGPLEDEQQAEDLGNNAQLNQLGDSILPKFANDVRVRVGDSELSLSEAVRQASDNSQLTEYRQLRVNFGATPTGQLRLARWCRSRGLDREAHLHWRILLTIQPGHPEALKRLGLRSYKGMLLTTDEIVEAKEEEKQIRQATKEWTPKLKKIRHRLRRGDEQEREAAAKELVSIRDPLAIPAIQELFLNEGQETLGYLVEVFAAMPDGNGIEFLVQQAVFSEFPQIRKEAIYRLSHRRYEEYVPKLIDGLSAPIELSTQFSKEAGRAIIESRRGYEYTGRISPFVRHRVRLSGNYSVRDVAAWGREVREVRGNVVTGFTPDQYRIKYQLLREGPDPDTPHESSGEIRSSDSSVRSAAEDLEKRVTEINKATAKRNQLIHETLVAVTGQNVAAKRLIAGDGNEAEVDPRPWWDWWRKQRESNNYFSEGMEVWTQTGPLPIEEILLGDRVLTRNPATGELTFNLVVGLDVQTQNEMRITEIDNRTILSTPEQYFFTTRAGRQKAAELKAGSLLESLAGPKSVTVVGQGPDIDTYSLLIEDSSNYFIDRLGIQVSDSTPWRTMKQ